MKSSLNQRFLVIYSCALTIVLAITVLCGAAALRSASFDTITVHRINVVEPDGTLRMVIADRSQFPGSMFHGKGVPRPDRSATGMLFLDDEGTENGGLIFGGRRDKSGRISSYGHLSFDQYEQDQVFTIDANNEDGERSSGLRINDVGDYALTPEVIAEATRIKALPQEKRADAWRSFRSKYSGDHPRAYLGRIPDKSVGLTLRDSEGRVRIVIKVNADGSPVIQLLDATGKVTNQVDASR